MADGSADRLDEGGITLVSAESYKNGNYDLEFLTEHYWDEEPDIPRVANGIEDRANRLKALGNGVVPQQFYPIFKAMADIELGRGE